MPQPVDPYGIPKWEPEQALTHIGSATGLEIVVLLAVGFGPGAGANFLRLLRLDASGWLLLF